MAVTWIEDRFPDGGDCRKLVTLKLEGMIWVDIRVWDGTRWGNHGVTERASVIAWQDLPRPADGMMTEREQAIKIANDWLDFKMNSLVQMVPGDPDCDACVLARQFLRAIERLEGHEGKNAHTRD